MQPKQEHRKINVAILIINRQFIRSWIDTGLIEKIATTEKFIVKIFAPQNVYEKLPNLAFAETENLGEIKISKRTIHTIGMELVNHRKLSRTFDWKFKRLFLPQTFMFPRTGGLGFRAKWFLRSFKQFLGNTLNNKLAIIYFVKPLQIFFGLYFKILNEKLDIPKQIVAFNPDWLIMPSASAHGIINDCLVGANLRGIKTLIAIDNWDQLTGKSTYPTKPDYFTVMGNRCVEHALNIHGCNIEQVLPYGLPRFDIYRKLKHTCQLKDPELGIKILYCGFAMAHSEKFVVDSLADFFDQKYGSGVIRFTYRPHPGPSPREDNYEIQNQNVEITKYLDLDRTAMPDMDQDFIDELTSANLVVGAPTTLMVEAMLLNRPVLLDLTKDEYHRTTSGIISTKFTHVLDLLEISDIPRGNNIPELIRAIENQIESQTNCAHYAITKLFDTSKPPYSDQLIRLLSSAFDE